jgi:hypothetical protein
MSPELPRPMAKIIAAAKSVNELIDDVEHAGGIEFDDGIPQDLSELRILLGGVGSWSVHEIKVVENMAPDIMKNLVPRDGFSIKIMKLFFEKLGKRKKVLAAES